MNSLRVVGGWECVGCVLTSPKSFYKFYSPPAQESNMVPRRFLSTPDQGTPELEGEIGWWERG